MDKLNLLMNRILFCIIGLLTGLILALGIFALDQQQTRKMLSNSKMMSTQRVIIIDQRSH